MLMKRLSSSIRLRSICMLRSEFLMTWFIPGSITSTFTEDVGIVGRITMARGYLLRGDLSHRFYSGIELTVSGITVTKSSDDMSEIEGIMMDDSTVPNFVVEVGKLSAEKNIGKI
jgi:hypothetical protein